MLFTVALILQISMGQLAVKSGSDPPGVGSVCRKTLVSGQHNIAQVSGVGTSRRVAAMRDVGVRSLCNTGLPGLFNVYVQRVHTANNSTDYFGLFEERPSVPCCTYTPGGRE
jgi:hypothetical protein